MVIATFTCPDCGRITRHPTDVRESYCPDCHAFKNEDYMTPRCMEPTCPHFGSYDACPDLIRHRVPPAKRNQE